jgi:hypothetical protein
MVDKKLIEKVDELREKLKDASNKLNASLQETDLFKKILAFALDEGIPDKKAKAYALKMTLDFFKNT